MNGAVSNGREWGVRPPVQIQEKRAEGVAQSIKVPRAQAAWFALAVAFAVFSSFIAPALVGQYIFYGVAGCAGLAAFIWSLNYESRWIECIVMTSFPPFIAWCFWSFSTRLGLAVPESWQPFAALLAIVLCVFAWLFALALGLAFLQELAYRSPFQEQSIYNALGDLLKLWGEKRLNAPPQQKTVNKYIVEVNTRDNRGGISEQYNLVPPIAEDTFISVCGILNTGKAFTEKNLRGSRKPLRSRDDVQKLRAWFVEKSLAEWNSVTERGEPVPQQGISFNGMGRAVIREMTAPPHPKPISDNGKDG